MAFCKKCGALLSFANGVCSRCGTQSMSGNSGKNKLEFASNNSGFAKSVVIDQLEKYLQLLVDNEELKTMIKPQNNFPSTPDSGYRKRSFMKFFWPFLVGGIVGGYVVYIGATFLTAFNAASSGRINSNSSAAQVSIMGDSIAGFIVALIVAAAIIFLGIKIAKRKQADFNSNADFMIEQAKERYNQGLQNQRMLDLFQENIGEMRKYESLVPENLRNPSGVGAIIDLLKEDKAQTVEEACSML